MKHDESTFVEEITELLVQQESLNKREGHDLAKGFAGSDEVYYEDFLLQQGFVDRVSLLKVLSKLFQVPAFDVRGYFFDTFELRKFPAGFLHRNVIIPLEQDEDVLILVAARPNNPELLPKIGQNVSNDIQYYVGLSHDIMNAISEFYDPSLTEGFQEQLEQEKQSLEMIRIEQAKRIIDNR